MPKLSELKVVIGLAKDGLRKLNQDLRTTKGKFRKNFGEISDLANKAGRAILLGMAAGLTAVVKAGADMQKIEVGFRSIMGGAEGASKMVDKLNAFTATTPFRLEEVASSARQLIAVGTGVDDVNDRLRMLGDIAAASGNSVGDISAAFAKVQAKGKVELENLNQLAERGIPIFAELKKVTGDANMEFGAGSVSVADYNQALANMAGEGGFANDAMNNLSETVSGKFSTAMDNLMLAMGDFAEKTGLLAGITDALDSATVTLARFATGNDDVNASLAQSEQLLQDLDKAHKGNAQSLSEQADAQVTAARKLNAILGTDESAMALAKAVDVASKAWDVYMESLTAASTLTKDPAQIIIDQFDAYNDAGLKATHTSSLLTAQLKDQIFTTKEAADAMANLNDAFGLQGFTGTLEDVAMDEEEMESEDTGWMDDYAARLNRLKEVAAEVGQGMQDAFNSAAQGMVISAGMIAGAMMAGTASARDMGNMVLQSIAGLAVQIGQIAIGTGLAIGGIKKALQTLNPIVAVAAGVALVALGSFAKASLAKSAEMSGIPHMAEGGLFTGSSLAMVGEGPGTSMANPEVVAPLDKLQSMLGGGNVNVTGRLDGRDILISSERSNFDRSRVRGF
jgi:hypothetical protein